MQTRDEVGYRLALAEDFLNEAEEESATEALAAARRSIKAAKNSIEVTRAWQKEQTDKD